MTTDAADEKAFDSQVLRRSVEEPLPTPSPQSPISGNWSDTIIWAVAQAGDEIEPWGQAVKVRDAQLRNFITQESTYGSCLGIVCARNSAFSWTMEGPQRTVTRYQRIFNEADFGRGWEHFVSKISNDLYTQDNGAFIEIVRATDSENGEVIGINHLDAGRCWHTGAPEAPVIYLNRKGEYRLLRWYQVIPLAEMPTAIELKYGLQYSALTRLLWSAQITRNIAIYDREKTGGRNVRAIHMIKGVSAAAIQDALNTQRVLLDARGLRRYSDPLIVSSLDPNADVGHDTLELASLPDNMDRDSAMKWYIAQIAMSFLEDYQTFAPLPGGNLGTSAQSEILHNKARTKGPGLFQKLMAHGINFRILPDNVEFRFEEQDLDGEAQEANVKSTRASTRATMIQSGEITPEAARVLAKDAGDLPEELFNALGGGDVTGDITVDDESDPNAQVGPQQTPTPTRLPQSQQTQPQQTFGQGVQRQMRFREQEDRAGPPEVEESRLEVEDLITEEVYDVFKKLQKDFLSAINK